jgi:tetratricopeptide (TPR) repeat protein
MSESKPVNDKKRQVIGGIIVILVIIGIGLVVRNSNSDSNSNKIPTTLEEADESIAANPQNPQAWYVKGVIQQTEVGDIEGAVESYTRALELNPIFLSALFNRGLALRELDRLDEAKVDFTRIVGLKRGEAPRALFNLGLIAIDQGNPELGERYLQRAYEQDPSLRP